MSRRLLVSLLALGALAAPAQAQAQIVNVLSPRVKPPPPGFNLGLGQSFELKYGNTDSIEIEGSLTARYIHDTHTLTAVAAADIVWIDEAYDTDQQLGHLRYLWRFHEEVVPLSLLTFVQAEADRFRAIDLRLVAGLGVEARVVQHEYLAVDVAAALMPEWEELHTDVDDDAGYTTRLSCYLTLATEATPWLTFASTTFVQPALHGRSDVRLLSENLLRIKVTRYFGLTVGLKVEHDTHPPRTVEPTDVTLEQGVTLKF